MPARNILKEEIAMQLPDNAAVVLITVVCFTAILAVLTLGLLGESGTQLKLANRQTSMEQAFYVAEGGAERGVSYIRNGGTIPNTITGFIGIGSYSVTIHPALDPSSAGDIHTAAGKININPPPSTNYEFLLVKADGKAICREDLLPSLEDYIGEAYLLHTKPYGTSDQYITVDNSGYTIARDTAYTFSSHAMTVALTNDQRNAKGQAVGKWWVELAGSAVNINDSSGASSLPVDYYTIYSIGNVKGIKRCVILDGVHRQSWAKYAMWYNSSDGAIWITSGDHFHGPVHANTYLYLDGDPVFEARVTTTESKWGTGSKPAQVTFKDGYEFNAPVQTMASVNFPALKANASLVITGLTSITFSNNNLLISNGHRKWTNYNYSAKDAGILTTGLIYIARASTGKGTNEATLSVGGVLDGRLTIATDYDIYITNHIRYAVHPSNNSDNALGLIARNDVVVRTNAPKNLDIFAHIVAACSTNSFTHGFYVQNYSTRQFSSNLNVYGGIVQYTRGAVGTTAGKGYLKNYRYDTRFNMNPPPRYPVLTNEYLWSGWREKTL